MLTYEHIKNRAITFSGGALVERGYESFLESLGDASAKFVDNMILDYFTLSFDNADCSVRDIYQAALVIFSRHPGQTLQFDCVSIISEFGVSPWSFEVQSPEEWVIRALRRELETGEGELTGPIDTAVIDDACVLIHSMTQSGIAMTRIEPLLSILCFERVGLEAEIRNELGLHARAYSAQEVMNDRRLGL